MSSYNVTIPIKEFREMLVEGDNGSWGDAFFEKTFNEYIEDDSITIEYKYGEYKNGKSQIKWRIPGTEKVYSCKYTGSSQFAMWWCNYTDDMEDDN